jgi:hypothetical protein
MVPKNPLEITVRNKVQSENIHAGSLFSKSYFQGNLGEPNFGESVARI